MKYLTLTWDEQRDLLDEGISEGVSKGTNLCLSCFRLVGAGLSDEEIAEQLGYELPEIQNIIDEYRAGLAPSAR